MDSSFKRAQQVRQGIRSQVENQIKDTQVGPESQAFGEDLLILQREEARICKRLFLFWVNEMPGIHYARDGGKSF